MKVLHTSRRRQETHSLLCALIPGQVLLSLDIQSWLESTVLDLRWLRAHTGSPWPFVICDLQWCNMGTFCSPNSEVDLMFILAAEFHIYTHRIHQRKRYKPSLDLKLNGIMWDFFKIFLYIVFSYPCILDLCPHTLCLCHHPWISDLLPKDSCSCLSEHRAKPDRTFTLCYSPFPALSRNTVS